MAKRLECIFNSVNGENTAVFTRTSMTKKSPSPGILYKKNCPDGKTFYCDPADGGTNNYYKLIDPASYKINYNGTVYVWLNKGHLVSWKEIDYDESLVSTNNETITDKTRKTATVNTSILNVYSKPSEKSSIVLTLEKNRTVVVYEQYSSGWCKIGDSLYVQSKYLKFENTKGTNTQITNSISNMATAITSGVKSNIESKDNLGGSSSSVWPSRTGGGSTVNEIAISPLRINRTSFFNDYSSFDNELKIIEQNLNIGIRKGNVDDIKHNMMNKFNRFKLVYPDLQLKNSFSHLFFTRPDLNLYDNDGIMLERVAIDPTFYYLNKNTPNLLRSLTRDFDKSHDFNPFLSNMAGSFELKDEVVQSIETAQTFTGHKMKYGRHNIESKTADSFSISYIDDQDYNIYKIHKAWTDYISKVYRGEFRSRTDNIRARVLDYACSVYYFLCAPDGETILFWSKYTGVFPTNTPSAASSWSKGNNVRLPDFTINYEYSWKEDFSPLSLAEFNINSKSTGSSIRYAKTYENMITTTGKTFVGAPFIETSVGNNGYTFKLRFKMP